MAIALAVFGIVAGLAAPRIARWIDRVAVLRAESEVASFYNRVRMAAVYRSARVRVVFTSDSLAAFLEGDGDTLIARAPGPRRHGVALDASRSVIRLYPNGLGLGGANTKLVLQRGAAADSLTISRLGRLKRWD